MARSTEASTTHDDGATSGGDTELGVPPNVLAVLAYVFNVVGAVILLVVEDNDYVRHHAAQSLVYTAVVVLARLAVNLVAAVLGLLPFVGDLLAGSLTVTFWVASGLGFLFLMYKGYSGERYRLPMVGQYIDGVEQAF